MVRRILYLSIFCFFILNGCAKREFGIYAWVVTDNLYTFDEYGVLRNPDYYLSTGSNFRLFCLVDPFLPGFFYTAQNPYIAQIPLNGKPIRIFLDRIGFPSLTIAELNSDLSKFKFKKEPTRVYSIVYIGSENFHSRKKNNNLWQEESFNSFYSENLKDSIFYETCVLKRTNFNSSFERVQCF